jgi:sucrose phosphorylase
MGMPAIYVHSLFGSQNDPEGVKATGRFRSINREQLQQDQLQLELETEGTLREQIFHALRKLIEIRVGEPCFHPNAPQRVLKCDDRLFTLTRKSPQGDEIWVVVNISNDPVHLLFSELQTGWGSGEQAVDLISGQTLQISESGELHLEPYQVMWIKRLKKEVVA